MLGVGPDIPVRHDKDGFRIPAADNPAAGAGVGVAIRLVLTLGCSFTYGATNAAEDTYPFLVGQYPGRYDNERRGARSYGLTQMLILAQRLVPTVKPNQTRSSSTRPGLPSEPCSHLHRSTSGRLQFRSSTAVEIRWAVHKQLFDTMTTDVPMDRYRGTGKNHPGFRLVFLARGPAPVGPRRPSHAVLQNERVARSDPRADQARSIRPVSRGQPARRGGIRLLGNRQRGQEHWHNSRRGGHWRRGSRYRLRGYSPRSSSSSTHKRRCCVA